MAARISGIRPTKPNVTKTDGKITISSVYLQQKTQAILPDADGFYKLWGGAFNVNNYVGDFYPFLAELEKEFTDPSSDFARRLASGLVGGEANHPAIIDIPTKEGKLARLNKLDKTRECLMVGKVELDYKSYVNDDGTPVIGVWLWIKPCGVYGDALKKSLEDPKINVCLSLRCLSHNVMRPNFTWIRTVTKALHYDWVEEQGISNATKFQSQGFSVESLNGNGKEMVEQFVSDDFEVTYSTAMALQSACEVEGASTENFGVDVAYLVQQTAKVSTTNHQAYLF